MSPNLTVKELDSTKRINKQVMFPIILVFQIVYIITDICLTQSSQTYKISNFVPKVGARAIC